MKTKLLKKPFLTLFVLVNLMFASITTNAQHSIVLIEPLPSPTIEEGGTQTLTFQYTTAAVNDKYQIRFVRKTMVAPWEEFELAPGVLVQDLPAAPSGATATATFTVPTNALTLAPLGENQFYMWIVSLFDSNWGGYTDNSSVVEITAALATNSFSKEGSNVLVQNPVGNQLMLNSNDFKSASIFDVSGRKVMEFSTIAGNNVDVSQLTKGIYFLVSDTNVKAKFLKK